MASLKFHLSSSVDEEGGDDDVEDADHKEGDHQHKRALNVFVFDKHIIFQEAKCLYLTSSYLQEHHW